MHNTGGWEIIEEIGGGGQSKVYLARSPKRVAERAACVADIRRWLDENKNDKLATSIWTYARPDSPTEVGALKKFKIRRVARSRKNA